jgi:hypothetical protein
MDVRFRGKSGHAADITGTTELDPDRTSKPRLCVFETHCLRA